MKALALGWLVLGQLLLVACGQGIEGARDPEQQGSGAKGGATALGGANAVAGSAAGSVSSSAGSGTGGTTPSAGSGSGGAPAGRRAAPRSRPKPPDLPQPAWPVRRRARTPPHRS